VNAPATEQPPLEEQATQPLPVASTLPPGHGAFKESGLWLFPGAPVAAAMVGIPLRQLWLTTADAQFVFTVALLVFVILLVNLAVLIPRRISRGRDGRS
jgi:hypothetical protein